ncbi:MAG: T9SS type A sorting domain-containing protein [Desulfobacterales bacterium]|nr:T9SS type A sorting domain-containing protein [Desulfobacterales bacterium]
MKTKSFLLTIIFWSTCLLSVAQIIHVPADQPTIQAGINAASNGDSVLVADGTYLENINFIGKAITVASHFIIDGDTNHINNTIIDGSQPSNPDYGSVVTFITGEDTASIICGFTITGGTGMIEPVYGSRIGGGIVCYYASANIIHNKITGNSVTSSGMDAYGGGIYRWMETGDHWIIIENNNITCNQCNTGTGIAAGGGIWVTGNARICENIIENNQCISSSGDADGGGIYHQSMNTPADTLILTNNLVCNNTIVAADLTRGGGVASESACCLVKNNTFSNNTIEGYTVVGCGLFVRYAVSTEITGNVFMHNTNIPTNRIMGVGCACLFPAGPTHIENNTFYANSGSFAVPSSSGGGLHIREALMEEVTVTRNAFISNAGRFGGGLYARSSYNLSVTNNLFDSNDSNDGGAVGMYIPASSVNMNPVFINNTFVNNSANNNGGATHFNCETNLPILFNCIFDENSAPTGNDISFVGNSDPIHLFYSDFDPNNIAGPWAGQGNINENPEFIMGDTLFHLSSTSPCKNAGTDSLEVNGTVYYAPPNDFDREGRPDPLYHIFDMGADENWEIPSPPVALYPDSIGVDYFIAQWRTTLLATGYFLYVAYDENFSQMVPGYDPLDVGPDTTALVSGLESQPYYLKVRGYNALYTSGNSNVIIVLEVPSEPVALYPDTIGVDYFIALWRTSLLATGYFLDVAYDANFSQMVPGYDNLDVGADTTAIVSGLESSPYYYRVRAYNALYTSQNSNVIIVLEVPVVELSGSSTGLSVHLFPNPACRTISLIYSLPSVVRVSICLYDLTGNKIRTLMDEEQGKGEHSFQDDLSILPKGLYLVRIQAGHQLVTKKLIIM